MAPSVDEPLKLVGFVTLLLVWLGAAAALTSLPLAALPDPVAALLFPLWLLPPFLLLGAYYPSRPRGPGQWRRGRRHSVTTGPP